MLADEEVEIVLNLTVPVVHAEVSMAALEAGKHVYTEKPLAVSLKDGRRMMALAAERGLRIGCAPDTFLGGGLQTCRKVMDEGIIGEPVAVTAFMMNHGPEDWHPNPDFFYQPGAGPMFDLGPYYLSALASLMGPVRRVTGSARVTFPERMISSQPHAGTSITVNTPTHVAGVMDFEGGAVGTLVTSFDVWSEHQSRIDLYGTEGTLSLPDPNTFGGPVRLWRSDENSWTETAPDPSLHRELQGSRTRRHGPGPALGQGSTGRAASSACTSSTSSTRSSIPQSVASTSRSTAPSTVPRRCRPGLHEAIFGGGA